MVSILIVDDNEPLAETLAQGLRRDGHEVEIATDGGKADRLVEQGDFALVITDIFMPDVDGVELIRRLGPFREAGGRVIAMSGGTASIEADLYLKAANSFGADVVLQKPFSIKDVCAMVRELLAPAAKPGSAD